MWELFKLKIVNNKLLLAFIIIYSTQIFSQDEYEQDFYGGLFYLSDYIASEKFQLMKNNFNDLALVDSIYNKCINFYNGNISEALLCLTFTCIPFNHIQLKFFNKKLKIPLPSPSKKIFYKRFEHLPSKLFFDSPKNDFGDLDKLSHFFGNAFLRYNFSPFNISKFMGIFVEITEQNFFANGGFDFRDLIANHLGELFAEMLMKNPNAKPSSALLIYQLLFYRDRL